MPFPWQCEHLPYLEVTMNDRQDTQAILVLGGTGKTGRRAARRFRGLGREPRDFAGYARETAATGIWSA